MVAPAGKPAYSTTSLLLDTGRDSGGVGAERDRFDVRAATPERDAVDGHTGADLAPQPDLSN